MKKKNIQVLNTNPAMLKTYDEFCKHMEDEQWDKDFATLMYTLVQNTEMETLFNSPTFIRMFTWWMTYKGVNLEEIVDLTT